MKKKFGQNFLINQDLINHIISCLNIDNNSLIYEVGPGDGSLTKEIIKKNPKKFICVEIDRDLKNKLDFFFFNKKKMYKLYFCDSLKFNEVKFLKKNITLVGNLPYNISLKLLSNWIINQSKYSCYKKMILMFQKEVAERILAKEGSKKYGRITLFASSVFEITKIIDIDKINFFPIPKVDSVLLEFTPLKKPYLNFGELTKLEFLTKNLFSNRRKKLKKKLESIFSPDKIKLYRINELFNLRPENLNKNIFYFLTKLI